MEFKKLPPDCSVRPIERTFGTGRKHQNTSARIPSYLHRNLLSFTPGLIDEVRVPAPITEAISSVTAMLPAKVTTCYTSQYGALLCRFLNGGLKVV